MYHLGQLQGQHEELLRKVSPIIELHERVRKDELDPATLDTHAGLDDFVEAVKKYQNNAAMLMAYCFMWRNEWKQEHGKPVEPPEAR